MEWGLVLAWLGESGVYAALVAFVATYIFTIVTDLGRTFLEVFFNFFRRPGVPPLVPLATNECALVIPCHNSDDVIAETLASLPKGYTVICVANCCRDKTVQVIKAAQETNPHIILQETHKAGKIRAVLLGALLAQKKGFTHFLLLDDDIQWPKDAAGNPSEVSVYNKERPITALPVVPCRVNLNWLRALQAIEYQMMCASKRAQGNLGNVIMASGAAGIYRVETFIEAVKDHDGEHVGDDLQCSYIHHTKGLKIDFNSELVVKTHPPATLKAWWKQRAKRWEASPVFNLRWAVKIIFAPVTGNRNPGWWIRGVTLYRALVIVNDLFRLASFPVVLVTSPVLLLGVWAITYCSVLAKMLAFRHFFQAESYVRVDPMTLGSVLAYPLYGVLMWASRLFAIPKGLGLNWKYYGIGSRKNATLASSISTLEKEIA